MTPHAPTHPPRSVLDLGSGSGRDCYVCAALVGEQGSVTGVDMTPAQLEVARRHADEYCTKVWWVLGACFLRQGVAACCIRS